MGTLSPSDPTLSVVVALVSDTTAQDYDLRHARGCLQALTEQVDAPSMEVILPYPANTPGIEALEAQFPGVRFLRVDDLKTLQRRGRSREHHDELRARGLAAARGEILAMLEDHARPDPHWSAQIVRAHQAEYAAIGGAMDNHIDRPLNWAVFFCDFGRYQNPLPAGVSPYASDANVSYKRAALDAIRPVWQEAFHETQANAALQARGDSLALSPEIIVSQHREGLTASSALRERFIWGQSYAISRIKGTPTSKRFVYALFTPALPFLLFWRRYRESARAGKKLDQFLNASPWILALLLAWSLGEVSGYILGEESA
jgi:hypothetical protein